MVRDALEGPAASFEALCRGKVAQPTAIVSFTSFFGRTAFAGRTKYSDETVGASGPTVA
jgi:hypothetical protein